MAVRAADSTWSVEPTAEGDSLVLTFVGPTPSRAFSEFLAALTECMPPTPATLVFDLRQLAGYNPETKEPMKAWLLQHKPAIREVVVVLPKAETMLKMVTAAIGLAVGVKITIREQLLGADLFA